MPNLNCYCKDFRKDCVSSIISSLRTIICFILIRVLIDLVNQQRIFCNYVDINNIVTCLDDKQIVCATRIFFRLTQCVLFARLLFSLSRLQDLGAVVLLCI